MMLHIHTYFGARLNSASTQKGNLHKREAAMSRAIASFVPRFFGGMKVITSLVPRCVLLLLLLLLLLFGGGEGVGLGNQAYYFFCSQVWVKGPVTAPGRRKSVR